MTACKLIFSLIDKTSFFAPFRKSFLWKRFIHISHICLINILWLLLAQMWWLIRNKYVKQRFTLLHLGSSLTYKSKILSILRSIYNNFIIYLTWATSDNIVFFSIRLSVVKVNTVWNFYVAFNTIALICFQTWEILYHALGQLNGSRDVNLVLKNILFRHFWLFYLRSALTVNIYRMKEIFKWNQWLTHALFRLE